MIYMGDYPTGATVRIPFDSFAGSTGASSATSNYVAGDVKIFKDGGTTERSSANGITASTSFDSRTGLNLITIDLSDNTDAGFYSAGSDYLVAVDEVTIDGQTVRFWAGAFSIERAGGVLALLKSGDAKVDVTKWLTGTPNALASGRVDSVVGAMSSGVITATAIESNAFTSAKFAAGAFDAVWTVSARTLTAGTNIQLPSNGLANVTAWTVNITGNLSGSVGSVTGLTPSRLDVDVSTRLAASSYTAPPSAGSNADAVRSELATELARIDADISSRLPTAGVQNLLFTVPAMGRGTVGESPTTTSLPTSSFLPAGVSVDQFKNRVVLFDADTATTGLRGAVARIEGSTDDANPTLTVTELPASPQEGDTFSVV